MHTGGFWVCEESLNSIYIHGVGFGFFLVNIPNIYKNMEHLTNLPAILTQGQC